MDQSRGSRPGLLITVTVTGAGEDDGTAAPKVLGQLTAEHRSRLVTVYGDQKDRNHSLDQWIKDAGVGYEIEVVKRPAGSVGFVKSDGWWSGRLPGLVVIGEIAGTTRIVPSGAIHT